MEIEEFGYKQELKRSLSLTDLVVYGMIFMIPIAPFGVYGQVIRHLICPVIGFFIVSAILYNMGVDAQKLGSIWIAVGLVYLFCLNRIGVSTVLPDPSNS